MVDTEFEGVVEVPFHLLRLSEMCGTGYIKGQCEGGHDYYSQLYCHKEYCPVCGRSGSQAHKRKINRAWDKVKGLSNFGYFVFTLPREIQDQLLSKDKINSLYDAVRRIVKAMGFEGGFNKAHFFGDREETYTDLFIHINAFVAPGRWLEAHELERVKDMWVNAVRGIVGKKYDSLCVQYRYYHEGQFGRDRFLRVMRHKLKYIMRPTIGFERLIRLSSGLQKGLIELLECDEEGKGRMNLIRWWGVLSGKDGALFERMVRELTEEDEIEATCPCCNKAMKWKYIDSLDVPSISVREEVRPGMFRIKDKCLGCEFLNGGWCRQSVCRIDNN